MAPITKTLALAGALFALSGIAAPVEKRAVVWETVTDVVWTTVDVTTTIYPDQAEPTVATATATVVPVTTTAAAEPTTTAAAAPQEDEKKKAAPTTSSTETPAPAPQPTEQPTVQQQQAAPAAETSSSTSSAPAPAETTARSTSSSSDSGSASSSGYTGSCSESSPCTGQMTYYDTATLATNPSSCGTTNDGETEFVLALPVGIMTDGDCGKSVTIEYKGTKKTGKVVDKCMGCDNSSIDLSRALFEAFASFSEGRLSDAKWYIN